MAAFNRVIVVGNVTRDVELRQAGQTQVTDLGLAVNERIKDKQGNWIDDTTFLDVTLWGRTAEVAAEYCEKGTPVLIEGRLKLDQWEQDGQKRSKLKVVGEKLQLMPNGKRTPLEESSQQETPARKPAAKPKQERQPVTVPPPDEDVPF